MVRAPALPSSTSPGEGGGGGVIHRFGYLARPAPGLAPLHTEAALTAALATFQQFGGINVTGELDQPTLELMATPRCGVPDVPDNLLEDIQLIDVGEEEEEEEEGVDNSTRAYFPSRRKRYALQGSRWRTRTLTYKIGECPAHSTNILPNFPCVKYSHNLTSQPPGKYATGIPRSQLDSQVHEAIVKLGAF